MRSRRTAVAFATLLSLIGASGAGCYSGIHLRPDQLVQLSPFHSKGTVTITTAQGDTVVEPARAPQLVLRGDPAPVIVNGIVSEYSDLILRAPLQRFRFEPSRVILSSQGPPGEAGVAGLRYRGPQGDYDIPTTAIRTGEILLGPPAEEPGGVRWGVGGGIAGPSRIASANLELRLFRHFAVEGGLLVVGPTFTAWAGAKVISPRIHRVALFAGGFVGAMGGEEGDTPTKPRAGPTTTRGVRFGVEMMFPTWADAVALEVDFLQQRSGPPDQDTFEGCRDGAICPSGGASYVHFF